MPQTHTVARGDGLSSIAERYGFSPDRIWNDPANDALRSRRPDPEILAVGDVVAVPDLAPKEVEAATGRRHTFRRVGVPAVLSLRLAGPGDAPRAGERYVLEVAGQRHEGVTDANGVLRHYVPPSARAAVLLVGTDGERYEVEIGGMDPIDDVAGVQKRLNNLGFACGEPDGALNADTVAALRRFQATRALEPNGALDEATRRALLDAHDVQGAQPGVR